MSAESEFIFGEDRRQRQGRVTVRPARPAVKSDPFAPIKRIWAGVASVVVAMLAGIAQTNSTMVESVETASGTAMQFNAPDAAFWWSIGLLGVSILLTMYASRKGGFREANHGRGR